jgi:hypothetical protein
MYVTFSVFCILFVCNWDLTQLSQRSFHFQKQYAKSCSRFPSCPQYEIPSLSTVILGLGKARSCREPNLPAGGGVADTPGRCDVLPKHTTHESWRKGRCIVVMKLPGTSCPQLRQFCPYCISQATKDFDLVLLSYCLANLSRPHDWLSRYS